MRAEGSFKVCSEFIFNRELPVSLVVNNDLSSFDSTNASILLSNADRSHFRRKYASQKLVDQDVETDPFLVFCRGFIPGIMIRCRNYFAIDQMQSRPILVELLMEKNVMCHCLMIVISRLCPQNKMLFGLNLIIS